MYITQLLPQQTSSIRRLDESVLLEDPVYRKFKTVGRYIAERRMSEKEILQVFADAEAGMTDKATGANRTMLGRGKDTTMDFAGGVKDAVSSVLNSIQNSVPVAAVDVAYDQATDALANMAGGQKGKVMQAIKGYRNLVKQYPKTAGFAKAALVAIAGLATGGAGLPAIAGLTYALDSAIRGDKLSSVLGKGAGATAVTWGGQQVAGALGGGDAATPDSNSQGPNVDDRIDAARARVDAANSKLGIDGSAQNYDVTGNVSQAAGVDTPLPQGATVRCPLGSCNGDAWQVKPGETFSDIAQQIGVPPEELVKLNPGLAGPGGTYTVMKGDQLGFIAQAQGTTPEAIRAANPDINFSKALQQGQEINLPAAGTPGQGSVWADYKGGMYGDKAAAQTAGSGTGSVGPTNLGPNFNPDNVPAGWTMKQAPSPIDTTAGTTQRYIPQSDGTWIDASTGKVADAAKLQASQDAVRNALRTGFKESIKFKTLPVDKLIDHKLTVMSWALNESVGKPQGQSVQLTTAGTYTVFENVDRYRKAVMELKGVPGSTRPAQYRPDMSGGAGVKSKPGIVGKGLNWLDKTAGKVGGALSNFGHQFTTNVTKEKLKMNWHQAGKPSDSDQLAAWLAKQGVPQDVVTSVYSKMGIPVSAPSPVPTPEPAPMDTNPAPTPSPTPVSINRSGIGRIAGSTEVASGLINPKTKKPYTYQELRAMGSEPETAPTTPTTPSTTPTVAPVGYNAKNVMNLPGMEKYAKQPAAPAKTANFGVPNAYSKTTTTVKPMAGVPGAKTATPAAPVAPAAPAAPGVPAAPTMKIGGQALNPKNPADKKIIDKVQAQAEKVAEALEIPVSKMLDLVETKEDVRQIKNFIDQTFVKYGMIGESAFVVRNTLIEHVTHVGAQRRREFARKNS
jgi:LysM repeat protein